MNVFEAFPSAIVNNVWMLGEVKRATVRGKEFSNPRFCSVIVDTGVSAVNDRSPSADYETTSTLLYAIPSDMPTLNPAELSTSYLWYNTETKEYFNIRDVSLGKNQTTGEIEHLEFLLQPTEVLVDEE